MSRGLRSKRRGVVVRRFGGSSGHERWMVGRMKDGISDSNLESQIQTRQKARQGAVTAAQKYPTLIVPLYALIASNQFFLASEINPDSC